jgi:hypothetical protein
MLWPPRVDLSMLQGTRSDAVKVDSTARALEARIVGRVREHRQRKPHTRQMLPVETDSPPVSPSHTLHPTHTLGVFLSQGRHPSSQLPAVRRRLRGECQ